MHANGQLSPNNMKIPNKYMVNKMIYCSFNLTSGFFGLTPKNDIATGDDKVSEEIEESPGTGSLLFGYFIIGIISLGLLFYGAYLQQR